MLFFVFGENVRIEVRIRSDGKIVPQLGDDKRHLAWLEVQQGGFVRYLTQVCGQRFGQPVDLELGAPDIGSYLHQLHVLRKCIQICQVLVVLRRV